VGLQCVPNRKNERGLAAPLLRTAFINLRQKTMIDQSLIQFINHSLDFVLIAAAVWMAVTVARLRLGGALSKSVNRVVIGAIILGFAHMVETIALQYDVDEHLNELIHRGIILFGFLALILGIKSLVGSFGKQGN
jgi:hypothetical protein